MSGEWFSGQCGGPGVRMLEDGSFEIEDIGQPSSPINNAVKSFAPLIKQWASAYGVPDSLIAGIVMRESMGNQFIVSKDHGYGLMQLTDDSLKEGHSNEELLQNASLNIQLGTKFVASLWQKYGGNPIHVLTSYNAGSPRCGGKVPNPWNLVNTQDYVGGVIALTNGAVNSGFFGGIPIKKSKASELSSNPMAAISFAAGIAGALYYIYPRWISRQFK
jgi:hypothetical protein